MRYQLKAYSIWDCGKRVDDNGAPHQEDSMFPAYGQATEADRLFILCDGMGGHDAGEVASATVCEAMGQSILSATSNPEGEFTEEMLQKALADAFVALDAKDDGTTEKKMGTTMTLLKLYDGGCFIAHMGDSRVYHIRPGKSATDTKILFRTEDHSLVNDLVKAGELTEEEAKHSRQKNVITRAMQPHMEHRPKADIYHTIDIRPGDYFYLCSDGMLENMEDHQLCFFFSEEAGDDENKRRSLIKATQENRDNHSAIIVHITNVIDPIKNGAICFNKSDRAPLMGEVHEGDNRQATMGKTVKSKKSKGGAWWIMALIVICLAVGIGLYTWIEQKPVDVSEEKGTEQIGEPGIECQESELPESGIAPTKPEMPAPSEQQVEPSSQQPEKTTTASNVFSVIGKAIGSDSSENDASNTLSDAESSQSETEENVAETQEEISAEGAEAGAGSPEEQDGTDESQKTEEPEAK